MAYPTATTCTKCGKPALLRRREDMATGTTKIRAAETPTTKLGYAYVVECPYCGLRFRSRLKHPS